jgi:hypothetical protein
MYLGQMLTVFWTLFIGFSRGEIDKVSPFAHLLKCVGSATLKTKSFAFLVSQFHLGDGRKTNKRLPIEIYGFGSSLSHKIINIEGKSEQF